MSVGRRGVDRAVHLSAAFAFAVLHVAGCATQGLPPGYNDALREVRRNAKAPGSFRYMQAFERTIAARLVAANRACRRLRVADTRGSLLLYRIDSNGEPGASFVHPATEYASCIHESVKSFRLEPPPQPDYWVGIALPSAEAPAKPLTAPTGP